MRTPLRPTSRRNVSSSITVPAPVGGWNVLNSLDSMPPEDAVSLINLFPDVGSVSLRKGFSSYATGMTGSVETLAEFKAGTTNKFIAAASGTIWNISTTGVATSLASAFTSNRWQVAQFDDAGGGARMGMVNGSDAPQIYNGTTVSAMTVSGTGLTPANLIGINVFQNRSYFWEQNSQDFWYSAVNALGGTLTKFPLGRLAGFSGNLVAMGTWTIDGGFGMDDMAAFIMSSGDVIIYAGSDPGTASSWSLTGIFRIGAPISTRCVLNIGADLLIMTKDGYIPLSKTLGLGRIYTSNSTISNKINGAVVSAAQLYGSNFGWSPIYYPRGNRILFNVPITASTSHQHVVNTTTGAWCRFEGMNAHCWGLFQDKLYFGGASGVVYLADTGKSDNGAAISGDGQTAWNYLGGRRSLKRFTASRLLYQADGGGLTASVGMGTDFGPIYAASVSSSSISKTSPWDTSPWDTSPWTSESATTANWQSVAAMGYNASTRVQVSSSTLGFSWYATGYLFEPGGLL